MSIQQRERTLDVWDGAGVLNNARIHESVLVIASQEVTRQELHVVAGDAHIISSIDEASEISSASFTSVVVFAAGLELTRELLQINALDGTARIHWHLGRDLHETLATLAQVELPFGVRVESINHATSGAVVTTGLTTGGVLDTLSFHRGVQAAGRHHNASNAHNASGQTTASDTEKLLQEKLLHTLQTVEPLIDAAPACTSPHDGAAEKELILLKRKYDAMERKYKSLAASRLGRLTLRLWALKRRIKPALATATKGL